MPLEANSTLLTGQASSTVYTYDVLSQEVVTWERLSMDVTGTRVLRFWWQVVCHLRFATVGLGREA